MVNDSFDTLSLPYVTNRTVDNCIIAEKSVVAARIFYAEELDRQQAGCSREWLEGG